MQLHPWNYFLFIVVFMGVHSILYIQGIFLYHGWLFQSVVAVAFQNVFHAEMHQNDIFLFFISTYQNDL